MNEQHSARPEDPSDEELRRNVATPERLPKGPHSEATRRAYMNHYADLQKFKLKVVVVLGVLVWIAHGCPL